MHWEDSSDENPAGAAFPTGPPVDGDVRSRLDNERFATLVPQHTAAMMRVAAALVGLADAEDAAQEAMVRAWRAWSTLRDVDSPRPWLLRITVNVCRGWQRGGFGRQAYYTQPLPEDDTDPGGLEALATLQGDAGSSDHTGALDLRQAISTLPPQFRVVIALHYYGGLQANEIAEALGIPAATVRTRHHRALQMLRGRLENVGASVRGVNEERE
ncbi:MAG TPA: RNA polymerase sigma factor [Ktedonobacterales bacterium]|nr:RNA polymerase sigma factor [Ktedonobacterales bacterium]